MAKLLWQLVQREGDHRAKLLLRLVLLEGDHRARLLLRLDQADHTVKLLLQLDQDDRREMPPEISSQDRQDTWKLPEGVCWEKWNTRLADDKETRHDCKGWFQWWGSQ